MAITSESSALRLELPPPGISRAGYGMFWIGLCFLGGWCAIVGAAHLINHAGSSSGGVYTPPDPLPLSEVPLIAWMVMGGFLVAGVGTTLAGLNMGVRRAIIALDPEALSVEQSDLLGRRRRRWRRDEIARIGAAASGFAVGGSKKRGGVGRSGAAGLTIDALCIELAGGGIIRLLAGHDAKELDRVAAQLRAALACDEYALRRSHAESG